ncbi:MAG TPA: VCBS repeat-containing protein, partial [Candidatus Limnocylindria bacterium]|nr:VCBS repeat-containing protein [Candidatus Limnocylindria bacterium]
MATHVLAEATGDPVCGPAKLGNGHQGPGTLKMSARLAQLARTSDPGLNVFLNGQRSKLWKISMERATNETARATSQLQYASELLRAGFNEQAVAEFESASRYMRTNNLKVSPQTAIQMGTHLGMAYMRMAEQRNCLSNHNADSCLFPITGGGVHQWRDGSENAIRVFSGVLAQKPDDLGVRWLLNIAYMTLGEYPDKVPAKWLVPTNVFQSEYNLPRFPDGAAAAGLDVEGLAGGCIAEDFDGDGLLDVMISSWSIAGQLRFFHNNGDGTFAERTQEAGLTGLLGGLHIVQTDYNNDGLMDVLVLRGAWMGRAGRLPNSLLKNNGDGTFEDVTDAAGLLSFHPTQSAAWFDFDGDGWL